MILPTTTAPPNQLQVRRSLASHQHGLSFALIP